MLTGYDLPFFPADKIKVSLDNLHQFSGYSDADRAMILSANALEILPRVAEATGRRS